ncbi:hypothetical protein [uncultured Dokdonia sp.]|uniref:hypothetical protein n=1 Tax=uncultured Dokdonia sp. TaxID=575653 RepID=UPI00261E9ACA|nr:hypothetical protein [uncultured Dokdonia sp.]
MNTQANPIETEVEEQGQLEAGFLFASFKNTGMGNVIVNGVILSAGEAKSYPFVGKAYQAISYDSQLSTLRILYIL